MNAFIKTFFILFLSIITFSCEKEETEETTESTSTTSVKIDGNTFVPTIVSAQIDEEKDLLNITMTDNTSTITITLSGTSTGTYTLNQSTNHVLAYVPNGATASTSNGNGEVSVTVVIESINTSKNTLNASFSGSVVSPLGGSEYTFTDGVIKDATLTTIEDEGGSSNSSNTLSASIDGSTFTPTSVTAVEASLFTMNNITITAIKGNETIGLTFPSNIAVGSYDLEGIGADYVGQYNAGSSYNTSESGTLNITAHNTSDKTISGTFSFTATPFLPNGGAYAITSGSFTVSY